MRNRQPHVFARKNTKKYLLRGNLVPTKCNIRRGFPAKLRSCPSIVGHAVAGNRCGTLWLADAFGIVFGGAVAGIRCGTLWLSRELDPECVDLG